MSESAQSATTAEPANETIRLAPVTRENWQACIHLQLNAAQSDRLASNLYSLAEAYVAPECVPLAIYAGSNMIGFVMYTLGEQLHGFTILRFMIDYAWQGTGFGAKALEVVIASLKARRPDQPIQVSITPDNEPARRLYERFGFEDTGRVEHGEHILRLL